jgi:hypothetical protein
MPGIPLKERSSFLKKRTKKLLLVWGMGAISPAPPAQSQKFFAPLFFKKAAASFHVLAID